MRAAKAGKSVAAVERFAQVGGGCTHWATIPSKALRQAIYHMSLCNQNAIGKADGWTAGRNSHFPNCWPRPIR